MKHLIFFDGNQFGKEKRGEEKRKSERKKDDVGRSGQILTHTLIEKICREVEKLRGRRRRRMLKWLRREGKEGKQNFRMQIRR